MNKGYVESFGIKKKTGVTRVPVDMVRWIEAAGNYVVFHTQTGRELYRSTMNALAEVLDPAFFLRVHRSYIVNRREVRTIEYQNNNTYRIEMSDGQVIVSGRSYKQFIGDRLAQERAGPVHRLATAPRSLEHGLGSQRALPE